MSNPTENNPHSVKDGSLFWWDAARFRVRNLAPTERPSLPYSLPADYTLELTCVVEGPNHLVGDVVYESLERLHKFAYLKPGAIIVVR